MISRVVAGLALSVVLAVTAHAQAGSDPAVNRIRADVTFLADDALEGRDTGSRGYDLAALYVAGRYQALGLTPAGNAEGTSWLQPVRFSSSRVSRGAMRWTAADGSEQAWEHGGAIGLFPDDVAGPQTVTAGMVFAGYGLDAPDQGYDDYRDLDVAGKIVLVYVGAPAGDDSGAGEALAAEKMQMAQARGAVGMIQMLTPAITEQFSWTQAIGYLVEPQMTWVEADGQPHGVTPGSELEGAIDQPVAAVLFAGAERSLAEVEAELGVEGAHPRGFPLTGTATLTMETTIETIDTANVAAVLPGSDPVLREQVVVVMAHLDHVGLSTDPDAPDRIHNGALDNASGVASMLEVARALSEADQAPRRTVMFLAVTGEEKGLLGSASFAANPATRLDRIAGVVNLDMPILLYDFTDVVAFGAEHSTMGPLVAAAAQSEGLTLSPDPMPEEGMFMRSDHYSFVERGVPSVFLATGPANGGADAGKAFLAGNYHGPGDDLSQAIHWEAAAKFARVNIAITRAIANAHVRPLWYEGDVYGDRFAPNAVKAPAP